MEYSHTVFETLKAIARWMDLPSFTRFCLSTKSSSSASLSLPSYLRVPYEEGRGAGTREQEPHARLAIHATAPRRPGLLNNCWPALCTSHSSDFTFNFQVVGDICVGGNRNFQGLVRCTLAVLANNSTRGDNGIL